MRRAPSSSVAMTSTAPWGNRVQLVEYAEVQFTKDARVLAGMGLPQLEKSESAAQELRKKGFR